MKYDPRRIAWLQQPGNGKKYRADLLNAESLDLVDSIFVWASHPEEAMVNAKEVFGVQHEHLHEFNIQIHGPVS